MPSLGASLLASSSYDPCRFFECHPEPLGIWALDGVDLSPTPTGTLWSEVQMCPIPSFLNAEDLVNRYGRGPLSETVSGDLPATRSPEFQTLLPPCFSSRLLDRFVELMSQSLPSCRCQSTVAKRSQGLGATHQPELPPECCHAPLSTVKFCRKISVEALLGSCQL